MNTDSILNVRKAYRLLFEYQKRILHLMQFISQTYDIPATKGNPLFSGKSGNKLTSWAWDWLYMYYYVFNFWRASEENPVWLNVYLMNDSGFYEKEGNDNNVAKKRDTSNFLEVEESKTNLILVAGLPNYEWLWPHETWPYSEFVKETTGLKIITKENGEQSTVVFKSFQVDDFFDEEKALESLKVFADLCKANNLPIEITEKIK
jgi:hypothetical protein